MRVRRGWAKQPLAWVLIFFVIMAFALATKWLGWPKDAASAGGFAEFVGALISAASLFLLVLSLNAQESTSQRGTNNHFLALQVQALIALIEDDRYKLTSMDAAGKKGSAAFSSIVARYGSRVAKLNELLKDELRLPALAAEEEHTQ